MRNKREIILDFTSLLDVIMLILFFFILFSHLETEDAKLSLHAAEQSAAEREEQAQQLYDEANDKLAEAEKKDKLAEAKLSEAEKAAERQGENVKGISEFDRSNNIRVKLKMLGGDNWRLDVYKGDEFAASADRTAASGAAGALKKALRDLGCDKENTLLCVFIYDASEAGTASAYREAQKIFDEVKKDYPHFFLSEVDISIY